MRTYAEQIANYLSSDPDAAPDGSDLSVATPLLGSLVGEPPAEGAQDARSWSGLAAGGIYTRVPKPYDPKDKHGATPVAFSATSGLIKPCLAVMQGSTLPHAQSERLRKAVLVAVEVWFYGPAHASGKAAMEAMRYRVDQLLSGYVYQTDQGPWAEVQFSLALGRRENGREFAGSLVDMARYHVVTLSGIEF